MEIEELRKLAAKNGMSLNYISKDEVLSKILKKLEGNDKSILKGGTAINRVYINNKRFSEDVDFDLVFDGSIKEAIKETDKIVNKLNNLEIEKPRIMHNTIRYDIYYKNSLNHKDRIRLEFNIIKKPQNYTKKIIQNGFVQYETALLNVYDIDVLISHKIECILNRKEGKDLFDLFYLLDLEHKKISDNVKKEIINRINLEKKEIKSMSNAINHYVQRDKRPVWEMFIEELKKKVEND